jgi:hypothetical protein
MLTYENLLKLNHAFRDGNIQHIPREWLTVKNLTDSSFMPNHSPATLAAKNKNLHLIPEHLLTDELLLHKPSRGSSALELAILNCFSQLPERQQTLKNLIDWEKTPHQILLVIIEQAHVIKPEWIQPIIKLQNELLTENILHCFFSKAPNLKNIQDEFLIENLLTQNNFHGRTPIQLLEERIPQKRDWAPYKIQDVTHLIMRLPEKLFNPVKHPALYKQLKLAKDLKVSQEKLNKALNHPSLTNHHVNTRGIVKQ